MMIFLFLFVNLKFYFKKIFLTALKDKLLNSFIELFKTESLNHPLPTFIICNFTLLVYLLTWNLLWNQLMLFLIPY